MMQNVSLNKGNNGEIPIVVRQSFIGLYGDCEVLHYVKDESYTTILRTFVYMPAIYL